MCIDDVGAEHVNDRLSVGDSIGRHVIQDDIGSANIHARLIRNSIRGELGQVGGVWRVNGQRVRWE